MKTYPLNKKKTEKIVAKKTVKKSVVKKTAVKKTAVKKTNNSHSEFKKSEKKINDIFKKNINRLKNHPRIQEKLKNEIKVPYEVSAPILKTNPNLIDNVGEVLEKVTLLVSANIFGFQFRKYTTLLIDSENKLVAQNDGFINNIIHLDYFHRTKEDFLNEAKKVNENYIEIQKNGDIPAYSIDFENPTDEPLECVLFGCNDNLLKPNFGSDNEIRLNASQKDVSYIMALQQSSTKPIKTKMIKIVSDNFNQLSQIMTITSKDANGQMAQTPLVTQSYMTNDVKNVLQISYPLIVDAGTSLSFIILPKTKGTMLFYADKTKPLDNSINEKEINLINGILSCQIQQGVNYVTIDNALKFVKLYRDNKHDITSLNLTATLNKIIKSGIIKVDNENGYIKYGVNFRISKIDGTIVDVDLLTALKKSEYKLKKSKK
jgi:hypothetical protein